MAQGHAETSVCTDGHDHGGAHDHHHDHDDHCHGHAAASASKMRLAVVLTLLFVAAEAVAGCFGHSLALLSDAGHNFADAAALGFSWYAMWIAQKPSHDRMTFGYHRVGILAALVNSVSLVVISLFIVWGGTDRLRHVEAANGPLMIGTATAAIVVNVLIG